MQIEKQFSFEAAHRLLVSSWSEEKNRQEYGKCYNLHGHSYELLISVSGVVDEDGMIIHFSGLSRFIKEKIINKFDHTFLNDLPEFFNIPTTVENIVTTIFQILKKNWPYSNLELAKITLYETKSSSCTLDTKNFLARGSP